jgi:hypothetical protein
MINNITCILDACSVINLIHIDEDDFILKRLKHLNIFICEKVFKEIGGNVYSKIEKLKKSQEREGDIESKKKQIDITLSFFRSLQVSNEKILADFGDNFFDIISENSSYTKPNGEFYSTALAIYLASTIPTKLFFHTDDCPAKEALGNFFSLQQIGLIEDTSDLLVLLYRLDESFDINQLDKLLSALFSEYAAEVSALEKRLLEVKSALPLNLRKDRNFTIALDKMLLKLKTHDFTELSNLKSYFFENKTRNKIICDILNLYDNVFYLESNSSDLLKKISNLRKSIKTVYCFL